MKKSKLIARCRGQLADEMVSLYREVLESNGGIQYKVYLWEDGEIELLQGVQGDSSSLRPKDSEPRCLYYVCTIDAPYFDPWDIAGHSAPEDEEERETERKEIIDWCVDDYAENISDVLAEVIKEAAADEEMIDLENGLRAELESCGL